MRYRALALLGCLLPLTAFAQLRLADWNITNYDGGRVSEFQTAIYGSFEGRRLAPDILMVQEMISAQGAAEFLALLNNAPGSPGDWAMAAFRSGVDTQSDFYYRTGKVDFLGATTVAVGSSDTSNQPRNTYRYDFAPKGYVGTTAVLAAYVVHLKAQGGTNSAGRRLVETQRVRANAATLPAGWNYLIAGDFNVQTSSEASYQELVGTKNPDTGKFFDPIKSPGSWYNHQSFQYIHTQDPAGSGGMDDRFDFILLSNSLIDGQGMDYIGNPNVAYRSDGWDDPNHSYRCWGNDGTSFNMTLTVTGNTMVGDTIAQALKTSAQNGGHLPVYLDMKVPPRVASTDAIDFGILPPGAVATRQIQVSNSGDVNLWTATGIAPLVYTVTASGNVVPPTGQFSSLAGASPNLHSVKFTANTPGYQTGVITIVNNSTDEPMRVIPYRARVLARKDIGGDLGG